MDSKSGKPVGSFRDLFEPPYLILATFGFVVIGAAWALFKVLPYPAGLGLGFAVFAFVAVKLMPHVRGRKAPSALLEAMEVAESVPVEETVEEILDQLGNDFLVLHDVRCQFGNIDHVVIGKQHGIFLIEVETEPGRVAVVDSKIRVNGKLPEVDFIGRNLRITYWFLEELRTLTTVDPGVTPLIVFTNASLEKNRLLKGITITSRKFLLKTIQDGAPSPAPEIWESRVDIARHFTASATAPEAPAI